MMNIPFSPPDITEAEIAEVVAALKSGWITTGPRTKKLETNLSTYLHTNKTVCLASATAALELTLRIMGIGKGDEVIVPAYTYTASASIIEHVGATIIMVDTAKDSFEFDYDALEKAITSKTKAIIPVDLAGKMVNYDRLFDIVERQKHQFHPNSPYQQALGRIMILADGAHSLGASYHGRMAGQVADFTCFSFHAVKNFTTAEGGAVTWRSLPTIKDEEIYHQFMLGSLHGQSKDALAKTKPGSWEYDIIYPAYKCNMTDILAALGLIQLERYPALLKRRQDMIAQYDQAFLAQGYKPLIHFEKDNISSGHLYLLRIPGFTEKQRNQLIIQMAEKGISTNVHYKPLPMLTAYQNLGFHIEDYPNAYAMYQNEITLPLHTLLTDEEIQYVIETTIACVKQIQQSEGL